MVYICSLTIICMSSETNPRLAVFCCKSAIAFLESSPLGRWLNGHPERSRTRAYDCWILVREEMTNPMGVLHGGVAAAMMDDVVGMMVYALTWVRLYFGQFEIATPLARLRRRSAYCWLHVIGAGKCGAWRMPYCQWNGKIIAKTATNLIQTGVKLPF